MDTTVELKLSDAQVRYLDDLLGDLEGIPIDLWPCVCRDVIEESEVFADYDSYEVWMEWLRTKTKH